MRSQASLLRTIKAMQARSRRLSSENQYLKMAQDQNAMHMAAEFKRLSDRLTKLEKTVSLLAGAGIVQMGKKRRHK